MSSQTGRPTVIKLKISRRSTCRGAETASWSRQLATTVGLSTSSTLRPGLSSTKSTPAASPMPLPFRPCKKISSPFPCAATTSRYLTSGPASDRSSVSTAPSVAWLFARMALNSSRVRICHSFPALKKKIFFFFVTAMKKRIRQYNLVGVKPLLNLCVRYVQHNLASLQIDPALLPPEIQSLLFPLAPRASSSQ